MFLGTGLTSSATHAAGAPSRRYQGIAKDAGCAREDKRLDARGDCLFQQIECAGDIGVDEVLPAMGGDMRFVQGGALEDSPNAAHAVSYPRAIDYRADMSSKRRLNHVEAGDLVLPALEGADQRFA
jgi:hypothetical protein